MTGPASRLPLLPDFWTLTHPLENIRTERLARRFKLMAIATALLIAAVWFFAASMRTLAAPYGVLSFELAGDAFVARTIVTTWSGEQRIYAGFLIGLRFLIGLFLALTLRMGCLWQASEVRRWIRSLALTGVALAYLQLAAGVLEAATNILLISQLIDGTFDPSARQTLQVAVVKYALFGAGVMYVGLMPAINRLRPPVEVLVRPLSAPR